MARSQDNPHDLTDQELKFCHEYAVDLNGTKAVKRAGFKYSSENAAAKRASDLLRKPHIRAYLAEILDLTTVSVVTEIARIAFANLTDICDFNNGGITFKDSQTLSDRSKSALKSVKVTERFDAEGGRSITTEIRMHDKLSALEKLMKKLRLYPSSVDVLEAIKLLSAEGLLVPGQVEAVQGGLDQIRDNMQALNNTSTRFDDHAPIEVS